MLLNVKELESYRIGASDGVIGSVKDFYFDDDSWVIRYVVVDTSAWLGGRDVLISPYSIGVPDVGGKLLPVSITKERVKSSPSIDIHKPVSRQHEMEYLGYYGYPYYWGGTGLWGEGAYPGAMLGGVGLTGSDLAFTRAQAASDRGELQAEEARRAHEDPHLRSCNAVKGYHLQATDGEVGHVQGYLVDDRSWAIQYLIVNTSNWWVGHQVLVAPEWIEDVSWLYSKVNVNLNRQQIKDAPTYDPNVALSREDEAGLYRHYGRKTYWPAGASRAAA